MHVTMMAKMMFMEGERWLRYDALRCATTRHDALHCATLHYAALRYTALRCAAYIESVKWAERKKPNKVARKIQPL